MAHVHLSILISLFFWRATSTLTKRYAYAPDGERIWKGTNGAVTRTPFAHYEVDVASNTVTRYYSFGGQLIAMRQGSAQLTSLTRVILMGGIQSSIVGHQSLVKETWDTSSIDHNRSRFQ